MSCARCGFEAGPNAAFCPQCGSRIGSEPTGLAAGVASDAGATRVVTGLAPGADFGPRYRVLRRLGQGGMGVVYQAWDNDLGTAVALKLIRPEMLEGGSAADDLERRFKRELLTARQVTHKNVVRIHDLGQHDGIKYLTMPYIEGWDLGTLIGREGALPVRRALGLARQIAAGLQAAHEAGVVHRDLKPENVMIDADDQAVIMDFGLARPTGGQTVTAAGAVVGTVSYMAPEQARGEPVDHRADIYAFGLVLYDMLAGRRRLGQHGDAMSEMLARMREPPPPLAQLEPRVPAALSQVVMRAIAPSAEARYQSVAELIAALSALDAEGHAIAVPQPPAPEPPRRRLAIAAVAAALLLLAAGGVWWTLGRDGAATVSPVARDPVSVLIADFENQTGDPLFDGALEQALSLGIEGASFITTFPRRDAERAAQQIRPDGRLDEATARLVAQREGIKLTVAGSIAAAGSGYALSVRVIDPVPGTEIARASETVSGKDQVLGAMAALAGSLRTALGDATSESAMLAARETFTAASLEAARDYAEAQKLANANRDEDAIALYRRALDRDPQLGRAYAGWAASAFKLGRRDEAEQQYQAAFARLDRMTERERLRTLGTYYLNIAGNYDQAIDNFGTLVARFPADGAAHNNLALAYFHTLQFDKALAQGARLLEIYPQSALYRYNHALYAMYAGEFAVAADAGRRALALNPALPKAHLAVAMAALASGDTAAARRAYEEARTSGPRGPSLAAIGLADLALYEGRAADAVPLLREGAADDEAARSTAAAAGKIIALAEADLALSQRADALAAIARALDLSRDAAVLVPAARLFIDLDRASDASRLADQLDASVASRPRAYARLIRAMLLLDREQAVPALDALQEAQRLADLWLIRFYKGVAYVHARAYAEAIAEFDIVERRRGEATAVFLDDVPTFRYLVPVSYWLGRAHDGLGARDAAARHYQQYLALRQPAGDALARDAQARLAAIR